MKNLLFIGLATTLSFICIGQQSETSFTLKNAKVTYHHNKGLLQGHYTSYYTNGTKKAEGNFENNQRIGTWNVWNEKGELKVSRVYKNSFVFNQTQPVNTEIVAYHPTRNEKGVLETFMLKEKNIGWIQRVWRMVPVENNKNLFDDNKVFQAIHQSILEGLITGYNPNNDSFKEEIAADLIDFSNENMIGFKIKEESFFDTKRMVMESRIIGICPVVLDEKTQSPKDLVWIYYPDFREILAHNPVMADRVPEYVRSMEDIFFYRYFNSEITKVSNLNDLKIEDYAKGEEAQKEAEKFELLLIEREHDWWLK